MKKLLFALLLFAPVFAFAEDERPSAESVNQLAAAMGLETLMQATLNQVNDTLQQSTAELLQQIKTQLPPITADEETQIREILNNYVQSVVTSVDAGEAARIYTSALAERLSPREVNGAILYYGSDEGRNVLQAVAVASRELNDYVLTQMTNATRESQPVMFQELRALTEQLRQNQPQ